MAEEEKQVITPRSEDYSKWYLDVIRAAKLADNSPVRGCMVIRENGYAIWENIQKVLDHMFKEYKVKNAYFPLFIPKSFFEKEAEHVEGFAKECAVVTHSRLALDSSGKLVPDGKLEEPLIVRPTSETIIYSMYSKWINSFRDLPLLLNQWCNVVRMEMRTRPFLRTSEFLWQEGHGAFATEAEADKMTLEMLDAYADCAENYLAIPVIKGKKTEAEKFAGADYTTCIEAMMQDGKALQAGTSHMLGQNFAKAFNVKFLDGQNKEQFAWQISWGFSTRIIGALIMTHSDDTGLVLPPKIAPVKVVIATIKNDENILDKARQLQEELLNDFIETEVDDRDIRPGVKFFEIERNGVPLRIELGQKELEQDKFIIVRRDTGEKIETPANEVKEKVLELLEQIQKDLFAKAKKLQEDNTFETDSYEEFKDIFSKKNVFVVSDWCGTAECEAKIQEETGATIRVIPFDQKPKNAKCLCGKAAKERAVFAKAY